ncbi:ethanolamine utilization protein [Escherichia coli]|uniref:Ethanolamine utilization protein n=1 Tax=Escherichia coli TaxID=562 RepID=A0A485JBR9_ECOLX|nr:ethanolamine utilization protein [Escherichia coli]
MKEKQSLEQGAMQPSFKSVTGKGGIKVIDAAASSLVVSTAHSHTASD